MNVTIKGGDKWRAEIIKRVGGLDGYEAHVGIPAGSINPTTGKNIAEYAYYNEFGTSNMPARSFMRSTLAENEEKWARQVAAQIKAGRTAKEALFLVGEEAKSDVVDKIRSNVPPPLSPATVAAKFKRGKGQETSATRSGVAVKGDPSHTLIDTGDMLESIACEVVKS